MLVRSFDASGSALGPDQAVSADAARRPDVAARAGTGFVVVWPDARYGASENPLKGRFLDSAGLFMGAEFIVDGTPVAALYGMDNDARAIDLVRLGALTLKVGASGTLRFDEFASWRSPAPTAGP